MSTFSKQKQKYIQSLHNKKWRQHFGQFLVEGRKSILELVESNIEISEIFLCSDVDLGLLPRDKTHTATASEIQKCSTFKSNNYGIAVANAPKAEFPLNFESWVIMLDGVNDPGNLGTIIRLAHWYGIEHVICSHNTVDYLNPKVIASSMGSFCKVNVVYEDLELAIKKLNLPVYAASMEGSSAHSHKFPAKGVLLMGSESHGISEQIKSYTKEVVAIPSFGTAESLNVAVATGILLDNIKRSGFHQTIR